MICRLLPTGATRAIAGSIIPTYLGPTPTLAGAALSGIKHVESEGPFGKKKRPQAVRAEAAQVQEAEIAQRPRRLSPSTGINPDARLLFSRMHVIGDHQERRQNR